MRAFKCKLIVLAVGAVLATPAAFAQVVPADPASQATTSVPNLPAQASAQASDAVSAKTTARESKPVQSAQSKLGSSTSMSAQASSPPGKGNWWKDADTNGDGKISAVEATVNAAVSSRFSTIDSDSDGFLTTQEYRTFYTSTASQGEAHAAAHSAVVSRDLWIKLDVDADSRISRSEAAANVSMNSSFASMDSNSDGFVTQAEYSAYAKMNK